MIGGSYLYSDIMSAAQQNPIVIIPAYVGPDSIVDAIKEYSDITEADVEKYKFLKLGWFDFIPALAIGGYSAFKAGETAGKVFEKTPASLTGYLPTPPDFLKKSEPWVAAAAISAGLLSYKLLYPRIRSGVLEKVQTFITMCSGLSIANVLASQSQQNPFPESWVNKGKNFDESELALCNALNNLVEQGVHAYALLAQVGLNDSAVIPMENALRNYNYVLQQNQNYYSQRCNALSQSQEAGAYQALKREGKQAQIFGLKIQNVKNVISILKNGLNFAKDVVITGRDIIRWSVENPAPVGLMGMMSYYLWSKK